MSRSYERLPIETFGRHLLETGDLDPVYIALVDAKLDPDQQDRWLIAYWCFYHCGAASHLSEFHGDAFWAEMMIAARNELAAPDGGRWPRGHERRHFRGQQAVLAVEGLRSRYGSEPEEMVRRIGLASCSIQGSVPFKDISDRVQEHRGFGPWIAFKVADMLDRLGYVNVDFDEAAIFMYKDPAEAAERLFRETQGITAERVTINRAVVIPQVVEYLKTEFGDFTAPPLHERTVDLQEIETILCKWKSHMNGHYPLNNDIDEIRRGLAGWGETAARFGRALPTGV